MIEHYLSVMPKIEYVPSFDPKPSTGWHGVKALWYEGAAYHGKPTKIFAYIGYPDVDEGKKVPAVVLVHGGGGHAFAHWVKIWNERGYAAISMDVDGYIPKPEWKGLVGTEGQGYEHYTQELYGELADSAYTLAPGNDEVQTSDLPLDEQWLYHAVTNTILAHNILLSDSRIDADKIGITGVSWGSVITSIAIGYDTRYAFAIPIYGSAYLEYAKTKVCRGFQIEKARQLWSAADCLSNVTFPVFWLNALYDGAFCSYSNSLSYLHTKEQGSFLSIQEDLIHSHVDAWTREENYRFADCVLEKKLPFVLPVEEPEGFEMCTFRISVPEDFENVKARLIYFENGFELAETSKMDKKSRVAPAQIEGNVVTVVIPKNTTSYYVEFVGEVGDKQYISTTSWVMKGETE